MDTNADPTNEVPINADPTNEVLIDTALPVNHGAPTGEALIALGRLVDAGGDGLVLADEEVMDTAGRVCGSVLVVGVETWAAVVAGVEASRLGEGGSACGGDRLWEEGFAVGLRRGGRGSWRPARWREGFAAGRARAGTVRVRVWRGPGADGRPLGIEVASRRQALGLSQSELAALVPCQQSKVSEGESGGRPVPLPVLKRLEELEALRDGLVERMRGEALAARDAGRPVSLRTWRHGSAVEAPAVHRVAAALASASLRAEGVEAWIVDAAVDAAEAEGAS
jgi:transcriptional regulator with XRE-family HTH domain